jgi:hypothetical protein
MSRFVLLMLVIVLSVVQTQAGLSTALIIYEPV